MEKNISKIITIPIEISARHVHLTKEHLEMLFGNGYELKKFKELSQPGQFAAEETVKLTGPHGLMEKVRLIGPCRDHSQVELSMTDARNLGIDPPVRESSKISGSASLKISGPNGEVDLTEGAIIAQRHIHLDPETAEEYGLKSGDIVSVKIEGPRSLTFGEVVIRIDPSFKPAMHIDTDEANAAGINKDNSIGELIIIRE
jgi:putative phosphotransacetylase